MTFPVPPDDRPDPFEQPIRARVPDHVSRGAFSTGVIIMTAQTEFILDFIQNLGRPYQVVARVVMPHGVLPQLVDALQRNLELYRGRWGELYQIPQLQPIQSSIGQGTQVPMTPAPPLGTGPAMPIAPTPTTGQPPAPSTPPADSLGAAAGTQPPATPQPPVPQSAANQPPGERRPSAQEIYDDLKIRDELLSGVYANAVMIGHGPYEFSFDFITNFFPHSAVSCRVFLSAGQVPRFYDSLRGTWDQLRQRMIPPPDQRPDTPGPHA